MLYLIKGIDPDISTPMPGDSGGCLQALKPGPGLQPGCLSVDEVSDLTDHHMSSLSVLYLLVQLLSVLVHFLYIFYTQKANKTTQFSELVTWFCAILSARSILSLGAYVFALVAEKSPTLGNFVKIWLQFSLYGSFTGDYFSQLMVFVMAVNRLAVVCGVKAKFLDIFVSKRFRTPLIIFICLLISLTTAITLIQVSGMIRIFYISIGLVDSGTVKGQLLINRCFYIFPFGAILCYFAIYYYILKMERKTSIISPQTAESGKQGVSEQLLVTIVIYGITSLTFEFLNTRDWSYTVMKKVSLVTLLNIFSYLPEVALSIMLLVGNQEFRKKAESFRNRLACF
ncbi:Serpentine receptor class gamma [Caenorhabditis elegans]|uniref:Serpentine receptor class gamma n=1 Tax=Caenorhabditis elegans TaxID=6239 RepID=B1Q285_CAEEL|nr:Serpentine receptor class gamma [Caenorhabditis elegans]CAQ16162.1 Serpentine receptor class gamma [Caenorhabditis elegans]|eukprot:NP_001123034.1 Uncharacterized protein CELE_Y26G10.4 [Caenorhabditis elegans]